MRSGEAWPSDRRIFGTQTSRPNGGLYSEKGNTPWFDAIDKKDAVVGLPENSIYFA